MLKKILLLAFVLTLTSCATQGPSRDIASVGFGSDGPGQRTISNIEDPDSLSEDVFFKDSEEE
jgi:hypothetical protein